MDRNVNKKGRFLLLSKRMEKLSRRRSSITKRFYLIIFDSSLQERGLFPHQVTFASFNCVHWRK